MPRTMAYARCDELFCVVVHGSTAPTDAEWQSYVDDLVAWVPGLIGCLIFSEGGAPGAGQRRLVRDRLAPLGRLDARYAVLSNSLLVRGVVNALSLFSSHIRSFPLEAINDAVTHIGGALHSEALLASLAALRLRVRA